MKLPISFDEVAYFKNEYRGDLIITNGVLYYFPHTRVGYERYANEIGGKDSMFIFDLLGNLSPIFGTIPSIRLAADKGIKAGKFLKRTFRPTINSPRFNKIQLHFGNNDDRTFQIILDAYIKSIKNERLDFDENSIPKPMRFALGEIKNVKFGVKFSFDTDYDDHDFRVNLLHRNLFKKALKDCGFLK